MIDDLEKKCRELAEKRTDEGMGLTASIDREISLVLDQLDSMRKKDRQLEERLTNLELDVKTRILNLKTPPLEYNWDRWAKRKQMVHQLEHSRVRLEQQAQRFARDAEKEMHTLQTRLLELVNMREQLSSES